MSETEIELINAAKQMVANDDFKKKTVNLFIERIASFPENNEIYGVKYSKCFPVKFKLASRAREFGPKRLGILLECGLVVNDEIENKDFGSLSERAKNCLTSLGITTFQETLENLSNGKLSPGKSPRNYGKETHREVLLWCRKHLYRS